MNDLPEDLKAQRAIEDKLIKLGTEREALMRKTSDNIQAITDQIDVALDAGVTIERVAQLVRVSRQTLYRWKDGAIRVP